VGERGVTVKSARFHWQTSGANNDRDDLETLPGVGGKRVGGSGCRRTGDR
jgi:hypothetical protein